MTKQDLAVDELLKVANHNLSKILMEENFIAWASTLLMLVSVFMKRDIIIF